MRNGPCDCEMAELFNAPGQTDARDRFGARIIQPGADENKNLAAYRELSAMNFFRADSPPLLRMQGEKDTIIPVQHRRYIK